MRRVVLLFLALVVGCSGSHEYRARKPNRVKAPTIRLEAKEVREFVPVPGRVKAVNHMILASKTQGLVKKILVKEGDRVRKGQLLIVVDNADIRSRLKALKAMEKSVSGQIQSVKARLDYARRNYERFSRLFREGAATKEEYDRARTEYLSLKAQLKALRSKMKQVVQDRKALAQMLRYTAIKAPSDGVITAKHVDRGTFVNPGVPLLEMDSDSGIYEFVCNVDAKYRGLLKLGNALPVYLEGLNDVVMGDVESVSPYVDPATNTFRVRVLLRGNDLYGGLFGRLLLPVSETLKLLLPGSVLVERGNLKAVYLVDEKGTLHFQLVRLGYSYIKKGDLFVPEGIYLKRPIAGKWYEVLSGLREGDVVVSGSLEKVREGDVLE